jgi:hypothetical protein
MTDPERQLELPNTNLAILSTLEQAILRHPRARCAFCLKRRILFNMRIRAVGPGVIIAETKRLCAECAGIR